MSRNIEQYQRPIEQFVNELCHRYYKHSQPEDRMDIRNEVMLTACENFHRAESLNDTRFMAWLHEIARNVVRNWSRREGTVARHTSGSLDDVDYGQSLTERIQSGDAMPEMAVLAQERVAMIQNAISALPLHHQQVIWLFYVEALPEKGIAKRLGIGKGTVKSRLHHARKRLAELLQSYVSAV